jgi:hypothetical protein
MRSNNIQTLGEKGISQHDSLHKAHPNSDSNLAFSTDSTSNDPSLVQTSAKTDNYNTMTEPSIKSLLADSLTKEKIPDPKQPDYED